jgi:multiple sugar transport system substrate-binding protein
MRRDALAHRGALALLGALAAAAALAGCGGGDEATGDSSGDAMEFAQWWEPELPEGSFQQIIDDFEAESGAEVKLLSGPYDSTKEQVVAGAATGTIPCVVGLDGAWVNDLAAQGAITDLSALMSDNGYDDSELASQIQVDGATYMIPVVNFVYPLFSNDDLLKAAGVDAAPSTRTEFADAAQKVSDAGDDASGWVLPLSLESPNGIQNDVMSWVWASGGSMLSDGQPDLTNDQVTGAIEYIQGLWDAGVIASGSFTMQEQDKVEEFTNGRVGMMIDSLAHVNLIRENNPELSFSISAIPAEDGYTGERGIPYASWGIGIAESCEDKETAWKLVEFLMSKDTNAELSSIAFAFPGNTESVPDFVADDELFKTAFDIYQSGYPANEFTGLPVAEELMRTFDEELQRMLSGEESVSEMLENAQETWMGEF